MKIVWFFAGLLTFATPALASSAYTLGPGSCAGPLTNGTIEIAHFAFFRGNPFESFFVPLPDGDVAVLQFERLFLKSAFVVSRGERKELEIKAERKADPANSFSAGFLDLSFSRSGQMVELRDLQIEMVKGSDLATKTGLSGVAVWGPDHPRAHEILDKFCLNPKN